MIRRNGIEAFLELSIKLSREAGRAIMDIYNEGDISFSSKSDNSPLTLADIASNRVLMDGLSRTALPVLSEENKEVPYEVRKDWKEFWLIDPLDGTKEFIKRNGEFTVNIALIKDNRPVLGVIYVPAKDILYYGIKGEGSWKVENDKKKRLICSNTIDKGLRIIGSRSHFSKDTEDFLKRLSRYFRGMSFVQAGSSLKFCLLAEGVADIYPRFGPTMEWDTGAGQLILEESGGKVLDAHSLKPLMYNKRDLTNPYFIATGQVVLHFLQ